LTFTSTGVRRPFDLQAIREWILELDDNPIRIAKMKLQGLAAHSRPCLQRARSFSLSHASIGDWMTEARLERAIID